MLAIARSILITSLVCSTLCMAQDTASTSENGSGEKDTVKTTQAATTTSQAILPQSNEAKSTSKFSAILDVTFETNTKEYNNEDKSLAATNWLFLYYTMNDLYKARLWLSYGKDLANTYEDTINDTKITFSRKAFKFSEELSLSPSVTGVIPTSEASSRGEGLQFGLEFNPSVVYKVTDSLTFNYLPRVVKNFHEYTTSESDESNTEYKLIQFFVFTYDISDKFYFEPLVIYSNTWSYQGTRRDPSYLTGLELGYNHNKDLTIAVGTNTGGSVVNQEQGPDQNIELYDVNNTTYYANVALKF